MEHDSDDPQQEFGDPADFEKGFSMELLSSEGGRILTLVLIANSRLTPSEFALALKEYAAQFEGAPDDSPLGDPIN